MAPRARSDGALTLELPTATLRVGAGRLELRLRAARPEDHGFLLRSIPKSAVEHVDLRDGLFVRLYQGPDLDLGALPDREANAAVLSEVLECPLRGGRARRRVPSEVTLLDARPPVEARPPGDDPTRRIDLDPALPAEPSSDGGTTEATEPADAGVFRDLIEDSMMLAATELPRATEASVQPEAPTVDEEEASK